MVPNVAKQILENKYRPCVHCFNIMLFESIHSTWKQEIRKRVDLNE